MQLRLHHHSLSLSLAAITHRKISFSQQTMLRKSTHLAQTTDESFFVVVPSLSLSLLLYPISMSAEINSKGHETYFQRWMVSRISEPLATFPFGSKAHWASPGCDGSCLKIYFHITELDSCMCLCVNLTLCRWNEKLLYHNFFFSFSRSLRLLLATSICIMCTEHTLTWT